jgi:hypothetical protein
MSGTERRLQWQRGLGGADDRGHDARQRGKEHFKALKKGTIMEQGIEARRLGDSFLLQIFHI